MSGVCGAWWGAAPGPFFRFVRFRPPPPHHLLNHWCPGRWLWALWLVLRLGKYSACWPVECSPPPPKSPHSSKGAFPHNGPVRLETRERGCLWENRQRTSPLGHHLGWATKRSVFVEELYHLWHKKKTKQKTPKNPSLVEVKGLFEQMINLYLTTLLFYSFSGLITFPFIKSF